MWYTLPSKRYGTNIIVCITSKQINIKTWYLVHKGLILSVTYCNLTKWNENGHFSENTA